MGGLNGAAPAQAAFPGVNGKIAFSTTRCQDQPGPAIFNSEIFLMNADGSSQVNLTNAPGENDDSPAWSPDGRRIAFETDLDSFPHEWNDIFTINADGSGRTNLTKAPAELAGTPAWSPDGRKIAYSSGLGGSIVVMNADGSGRTQLTNSPAGDYRPAWSPDGGKIAFTRGYFESSEIFVMNADGSGQAKLTTYGYDSLPSWSPDGTKIAFQSGFPASDIFVMNADGTGQTRITNNAVPDGWPVWSPDGTKIAFDTLRGSPRNYEIFVMNADGSGQTNLTKNPADDYSPDWQTRPSSPPPQSPPQRDCHVPNVIGQRIRAARTRIKRANCSVGRIRYVRSVQARGRVLRQTPRPGARFCHRTRVNLIVSRGHR